jgi:hypothetical protein
MREKLSNVHFGLLTSYHQKVVQGQIGILEMLNFDKELSIHKAGGIQ